MTVNGDAKVPLFDGAELSVTFLRTALGPSARPGLEFIRLIEKADAQGWRWCASARRSSRCRPTGRSVSSTRWC